MKKFPLLALLCLLACSSSAAVKRTEDVIYGRKFGVALTLDVFTPDKPNGLGIFYMVSGGFFSSHEAISPAFYQPLLDHGYTVFAVVHGSQPKFIIPEIEQDIQRAIRFVRHNAKKYGVDPKHMGISGASAGGHLSLIMATQGAPGQASAKDPIDREDSSVQCVACFFPPTDFLNWSAAGDDAVGYGKTLQFQPAFGPQALSAEGRKKLGEDISPILYVTSNLPPTLVMHGDSDKMVPIYQAQIFEKRCIEVHAPYKLIIKPGADHGWAHMEVDMETFAQWFDDHLKKKN